MNKQFNRTVFSKKMHQAGLNASALASELGVYRAAVSKRGVLSNMAQRMAQVFADGSTSEFIAALVRAENLTPEEVEELKRVVQRPRVTTTGLDDHRFATEPGCRGHQPLLTRRHPIYVRP